MVIQGNRPPKTGAIQIMVAGGFWDAGGRKAGTPFEIASMPVKAVQPEENARRSRNRVSPSTAGTDGNGCGSVAPKSARPKPTTITNPRRPTNREVGRAKILPDSRTPGRLPKVRPRI